MYPRVSDTKHMSSSPGDGSWSDLDSFETNHGSSLKDILEHLANDMSRFDSGKGTYTEFTEFTEGLSSRSQPMYGRFEPPADSTTGQNVECSKDPTITSDGSSGPYGHNSVYSQQGFSKLQNQNDDERHTPASLGWSKDSPTIDFYDLVIRKAKEPFLKLRPEHQVTWKTPPIVYFGQPE